MAEGEWNSFNGMGSEEADFMAQLLGNCSLPNEVPSNCHYPTSSTHWSGQESNVNVVGFYDGSVYSSDETNISTCSFPQGSSYGGGISPESYYHNMSHQFFVSNNNLVTMEYRNNAMKGDDFLNQDASNDSIESNDNSAEDFFKGKGLQLGREFETPMPEIMEEEKESSPSEMAKKRPRIPGDVQRSKISMKLKKILKVDDDDDEENNNNNNNKAAFHRQNSNSCSEDDSNVSHELNGVVSGSSGALNSNGKTRAGRGSATDPQSLYARKRRERINERLKVLQSLVPNGTKVDISTMLEEAVQYVKFLQLQIKLLSSDEHWMYSPIAYNGMDLGLDLRIPTPNSQP